MFLLLDARVFEIKFYLTVIPIKQFKRKREREREKDRDEYCRCIIAGRNSKGLKNELFRSKYGITMLCEELSLLYENEIQEN